MNKVITAFALSIIANGAFANGFSPWNAQSAEFSSTNEVQAEVLPAGFAPWRTRAETVDFRNEHGVAMEVKGTNIFRPWS